MGRSSSHSECGVLGWPAGGGGGGGGKVASCTPPEGWEVLSPRSACPYLRSDSPTHIQEESTRWGGPTGIFAEIFLQTGKCVFLRGVSCKHPRCWPYGRAGPGGCPWLSSNAKDTVRRKDSVNARKSKLNESKPPKHRTSQAGLLLRFSLLLRMTSRSLHIKTISWTLLSPSIMMSTSPVWLS